MPASNAPWNILLDRDGTVIVERHYLCDPDGVELVAGAGEAMARLAKRGARFYLVTNQSGIGRGYYGLEDFKAVQRRLAEHLELYGTRLEDTAFCPHAPSENCACRKPATGQWETLTARHGLDPARTAMAGDNASDVGFGLAAGLALVVLTLTGHGAESAKRLGLPELAGDFMRISPRLPDQPHVLARDLPAALAAIEAFMNEAEAAI